MKGKKHVSHSQPCSGRRSDGPPRGGIFGQSRYPHRRRKEDSKWRGCFIRAKLDQGSPRHEFLRERTETDRRGVAILATPVDLSEKSQKQRVATSTATLIPRNRVKRFAGSFFTYN